MLFGRRISLDTSSGSGADDVSGDLGPPDAKRRKTNNDDSSNDTRKSQNGTQPSKPTLQDAQTAAAMSYSPSSTADEIPAWGLEIIRNVAALSERLLLVEKGVEILLMERERNLLAQSSNPTATLPVPALPAPPSSSSSSSAVSLSLGGSVNTRSISASPMKENIIDRIPIPLMSVVDAAVVSTSQKRSPIRLDGSHTFTLIRDSRRLLHLEPWNEHLLPDLLAEIAYENPKVEVNLLNSQKLLVVSSELRSLKFPKLGISTLANRPFLTAALLTISPGRHLELTPAEFIPPTEKDMRDTTVVCMKLAPPMKWDQPIQDSKRLLRQVFDFEKKSLESFHLETKNVMYVRFYTRRAACEACMRSGYVVGNTPFIAFIYPVDESELKGKSCAKFGN